MSTVRLHVGGLHEQITDKELQQRFEGFGKVTEVEVIRNSKGNCKGFGYVTFEADESVLKKCTAVLNNAKWRGHVLHIAKAKEHYMSKLEKEWDEKKKAEEAAAVPKEEIKQKKIFAWKRGKGGRMLPVMHITGRNGKTILVDPSKLKDQITILEGAVDARSKPISMLSWTYDESGKKARSAPMPVQRAAQPEDDTARALRQEKQKTLALLASMGLAGTDDGPVGGEPRASKTTAVKKKHTESHVHKQEPKGDEVHAEEPDDSDVSGGADEGAEEALDEAQEVREEEAAAEAEEDAAVEAEEDAAKEAVEAEEDAAEEAVEAAEEAAVDVVEAEMEAAAEAAEAELEEAAEAAEAELEAEVDVLEAADEEAADEEEEAVVEAAEASEEEAADAEAEADAEEEAAVEADAEAEGETSAEKEAEDGAGAQEAEDAVSEEAVADEARNAPDADEQSAGDVAAASKLKATGAKRAAAAPVAATAPTGAKKTKTYDVAVPSLRALLHPDANFSLLSVLPPVPEAATVPEPVTASNEQQKKPAPKRKAAEIVPPAAVEPVFLWKKGTDEPAEPAAGDDFWINVSGGDAKKQWEAERSYFTLDYKKKHKSATKRIARFVQKATSK